MNLKTILSICAVSLLSACSTHQKNGNIQSIRLEPKPDFSGMSLILSSKAVITSPTVLKKEFRFTTDENELNLQATVADDLNIFSEENSKKIIKLVHDANTLKITTSFTNNSEFDLTKQKSEIQEKIKACI